MLVMKSGRRTRLGIEGCGCSVHSTAVFMAMEDAMVWCSAGMAAEHSSDCTAIAIEPWDG